MPINPDKVQAAKIQLTDLMNGYLDHFKNSQIIDEFNLQRLIKKAEAFTAKAKKKIYTIEDSVIKEDFNPNSDKQLQELLFDYLGFPVIDLTKGKQPSTGAKTLKKLLNHTTDQEHKDLLDNLIGLSEVSIILTTFITAFENAQQLPDGSYRLYGNFNLGGTQSLRLSSSNPNLQNIPSHSKYAKIIKECFEPIKGWLFVGSDLDSLEDKINALLTKDPQKKKFTLMDLMVTVSERYLIFRTRSLVLMRILLLLSIRSKRNIWIYAKHLSQLRLLLLTGELL